VRIEQGVQGAKSASELAKHVRDVESLRDKAGDLQRAIEAATGKKAREKIAKELDKVRRMIEGHEKEIRQKWPDVAEIICP
jgi:hypothetical protein